MAEWDIDGVVCILGALDGVVSEREIRIREAGAKAGRAGRGRSKVRGSSAYYSAINRLRYRHGHRWEKKKLPE